MWNRPLPNPSRRREGLYQSAGFTPPSHLGEGGWREKAIEKRRG